jgi:hypothetical protein
MDESTTSPAGFSPYEMDSLMKYFVGNNCKYREQIIIPRTVGPIHIKSIDEKRVEAAFESCAFKSLVASVMGTPRTIQQTQLYFDYNVLIILFRLWVGGCIGIVQCQCES